VFLQPVSRIFGVDDERIIALAAILQMNGYSAKFYTSPLEALTAARSGAPELLLSAVMPPSIEERRGFPSLGLHWTEDSRCLLQIGSGRMLV
jgi:DNA-binding response OmpR family regulator